MLIQKIYQKGILHLQRIVSQPFSANREPHTAIGNLNIQKWHVYDHGCQRRKLQRKNIFSQAERAVVTAELIFDGEIARS